MTTEHWLTDLEAKAMAATPGPWANTDTVTDMFEVEPSDWWNIYAKFPGEDCPCIPIMQMIALATEEEMSQAREDHFRKKLPMRDPGQSGKNARFVAVANPSAVLRLVALVRIMADWLEDKAMLQEINDSGDLKWSALSARDWLENAYTAVEKNNGQS